MRHSTKKSRMKKPPIPSLKITAIQLYPDGRLDTHNAALYLGITEKTLSAMRSNGRGPKFIKRCKIFYFKEDLDAWLHSEGKFSSTTQVATKAKVAQRNRKAS